MSRARFADTSYWFALHVTADRNHAVAHQIQPGRSIATSELVLGETWTLVNRRVGHAAAVSCIRLIRRLPGVDVVSETSGDRAAAWQWLDRHDEREYSFVDAVSFVLMRRLRIRDALAFDGDFSAAGFVEIRPGA